MSLKVHIIITLLCVIGGVLSKTNGITISDFDDDIKGVTDDDFIHVHIVPHTHDVSLFCYFFFLLKQNKGCWLVKDR